MPKTKPKNPKSLVEMCLDSLFNKFFRNIDGGEINSGMVRHPRPFDQLRKTTVCYYYLELY